MSAWIGSVPIRGTVRKPPPKSNTTLEIKDNRLHFKAADRYCRDELLYYHGRPIVNFIKNNPGAILLAKETNPDFQLLHYNRSDKVIRAAIETVMGPWVDSLNPIASPYFLRLIIGLARNSGVSGGAEKQVLNQLQRYQKTGGEWTPSMRDAWVPGANWTQMGGFGLTLLARGNPRGLITKQEKLAFPRNTKKAWPAWGY